METRVMLTMESRIHGNMYVRFGGRLVETYHRKVAKRCWPSLLKEVADLAKINRHLTSHIGRHTFATLSLSNHVPIESISKMLGHSDIRTTQIYAKMQDKTVYEDMATMRQKFDCVMMN
ncbi:MAG: tyrosine-type recombinase/integrase [Parabacteroides goldsteinii]